MTLLVPAQPGVAAPATGVPGSDPSTRRLWRRAWQRCFLVPLTVLAPLVALTLYIGLVPNHVLQPMAASVDRFAVEYVAKLRAGQDHPYARALLEENYAPSHEPAGAPKERARLAVRAP